MKILKIATGEIRHGYEYEELDENVRETVLEEMRDFLISTAESDEEATECFEDSYVVDFIKANDYLFDEDGKILPVTYHYHQDIFEKVTFGKKQHDLQILETIKERSGKD